MNTKNSLELAKRKTNVKRAKILSFLKKKNLELAFAIDLYVKNNLLDDQTKEHLFRIIKNVRECSNLSLYKKSVSSGEVIYLTSAMCEDKNCMICNWARQKVTRRKYAKWFKENNYLLHIRSNDNGKVKIVTESTFKKKFELSHEVISKSEFDLLFLTLSVPHSQNGFRSQPFYFEEITRLFWLMRKTTAWLEWVYGGEYGIEVTKGDNGLHIHIHSLILTKKGTQSRNEIHKMILLEWNRLTNDPGSSHKHMTIERAESIIKGNKLMTLDEALCLDPGAATSISLESVYYLNLAGKKVYVKDRTQKEMLYAITEAISYHFAPFTFNKTEKAIDIPLLAEVAKHIFGKPLYKKFGCLHGEESLNIKARYLQIKEDFDSVSGFDPETGEIFENSIIDFYEYFFLNPAYTYANSTIKITVPGMNKIRKIDAINSSEAIGFLTDQLKNKKFENQKYARKDLVSN